VASPGSPAPPRNPRARCIQALREKNRAAAPSEEAERAAREDDKDRGEEERARSAGIAAKAMNPAKLPIPA